MSGAQCINEANGKAGAADMSGALIGPDSWLEWGGESDREEDERHDGG